jgi:hypothetical protein
MLKIQGLMKHPCREWAPSLTGVIDVHRVSQMMCAMHIRHHSASAGGLCGGLVGKREELVLPERMRLMLIRFLLLWQNSWDTQLVRRNGLFWLIVSETSVHGQLAPLLSSLCRGSTSQQKCMAEESWSLHGDWEAERERERGRDWGPCIPFRDTPPII